MGHSFQHMGFISDRRRLRNGRGAALGNLQRGAAILPDLDRMPRHSGRRAYRNWWMDGNGASHPDELSRPGFHSYVAHHRVVYRQSDGRALDRDRIWLGLGDFIRILDHRLPGGAARDGGQGSALGPTGYGNWCVLQDDGALYRYSSGLAGTRRAA